MTEFRTWSRERAIVPRTLIATFWLGLLLVGCSPPQIEPADSAPVAESPDDAPDIEIDTPPLVEESGEPERIPGLEVMSEREFKRQLNGLVRNPASSDLLAYTRERILTLNEDLELKRQTSKLSPPGLSLLAFNDDGSFAIASNFKRGLWIYLDPQTLEVTRSIEDDYNVLTNAVAVPNSDIMIGSAAANESVGFGLLPNIGQRMGPFEPVARDPDDIVQVNEGDIRKLLISEDGTKLLALVGSGNEYINQTAPERIWLSSVDPDTGALATSQVTPVPYTLMSAVNSQDGKAAYVLAWDEDTDRTVFLTYSWEEQRVLTQEYIVTGRKAFALVPQTDLIIVGGFGKLQLFDPAIETVVAEVPVSGDNVEGVVIDESQQKAYVLSTTRGDSVGSWITVVELSGGS